MIILSLDNGYILLNTLVANFVTAGGLGFINYVILEKFEIIRNKKTSRDEKKLFILFFSLVNYALFLYVFKFPNKELPIRDFVVRLSLGIIITLVISVLLTFTIYPLLAKVLLELTNWFRTKILNKPISSNLTEKERLFSRNDVYTYLYIFDFDKMLIGEGYLDGWLNDTDDKNQLTLLKGNPDNNYTFDEVNQMVNEQFNDPNENTTRHLIDFDQKLHYFIFYQSKVF